MSCNVECLPQYAHEDNSDLKRMFLTILPFGATMLILTQTHFEQIIDRGDSRIVLIKQK